MEVLRQYLSQVVWTTQQEGWNSNAGFQTGSDGLSLKIVFQLSKTYSRMKKIGS